MDIEFFKKLKKQPAEPIENPTAEPTKRLFSDYKIVFTDGSEKTLYGVAIGSHQNKTVVYFLDKDYNTIFVAPYSSVKYVNEVGYA